MKDKIIIIGNGAAGNAALEEILSQNLPCEITVITSEALPIYYRPMLSEYISEPETPKRFFLHEKSWYDSNHIDIMYEKTVAAINTSDQTITLSDEQLLSYDKLIIATGSKNFIPPIPGSKGINVFDLRTYEDAERIKTKANDAKKAVIIGGGLLGLELGWQLRKLNIDVTVIEMMQRLLPRQLDEEASIIFEEKVNATGIRVLKGIQTMEIVGDGSTTGVLLSTGETVFADMVIFSIGIRADVTLAKDAGISIERGIIVNDFMETNFKNIFAAGDCAEFAGVNYAIWPEAVEQGKVAGLNAIGIKTVYQPVIPFNIYHGMNMRLFSIGDVGGNPANEYSIERKGDSENFEKYFYIGDRLVGGILIGNISKSGKLKKGVAENLTKDAFEKF